MSRYTNAVLTSSDSVRYSRQLSLPEFGPAAQEKLGASSVLLVGAGGLGSPVALYLAAAGVGRITIVDSDQVELSNLHRQIVHDTASIGAKKAASAAQRLSALNSDITVKAIVARVDESNVDKLVNGHDLTVDGSDNFETRYLVNDASFRAGKPWVFGSVFRFEGQASLFDPTRGICYRCLYPRPPRPDEVPSCEEGGVLGVVPGLIGLIQATEALKQLTGIGRTLAGRLLLFDAQTMRFREIALRRGADCPLHGTAIALPAESVGTHSESALQEKSPMREITPNELDEQVKQGVAIQLVDVREPHEWEISRLEGAVLIPQATLPERVSELQPDAYTVVYCRSGMRSARAAAWLQQNGFSNVVNLAGGINLWAREVDPSVATY